MPVIAVAEVEIDGAIISTGGLFCPAPNALDVGDSESFRGLVLEVAGAIEVPGQEEFDGNIKPGAIPLTVPPRPPMLRTGLRCEGGGGVLLSIWVGA